MADPIKFYKGEETGIVHESYMEKETSLFKDQYLKALNEIGAYLSYYKTIDDINNETDDEEDDGQITKQNKSKKQPQHIELNNIFAFIGERGTGKTSCMKSVADMLYQYRKSTNKNGCEKFLKIAPIDPTTFNDNTNLMQVVIGVMFEKFKDKVASSDNLPCNADRDTYEKNKQNLLKSFQDVKECIKYISNPDLLKCEDDDISQLAGMASVSKLNDKIGKLADRYLEFFDKNILVLQIDDIDLQTKYAYQMVEEIRKYFMHKNIIVLMAVKMEQLAKVIENETAKQYEPLKKLDGITLPEISDMAIRYLLKLIPINHRIYMPTFEVYVDSLIEYLPNHEPEQKSLIGNGSPMSVKYAVTSLIYEKCRFLFYHSKGVISPIVPRNLRELRHLLAMLEGLPNITNEHQKKNNKSVFLKYFYSTWVNNNISVEDLAIVRSIEQVKDAASINKVILQILKKRFKNILTEIIRISHRRDDLWIEDRVDDTFKDIMNFKNVSYNTSIGDVFVIIDYIKKRISDIYDKMLIFYIESFYSMKLYEYYEELLLIEGGESSSERIEGNVRREEIVDEYSNYEILVGGNFINVDYYPVLPKIQATGEKRDKRVILYQNLKKEAQIAINERSAEKLKRVEFLALCISMISEKNLNTGYRQQNTLYYDADENSGKKYAEFNLGAFFANIVNIERAYKRVNVELYSTAKEVDGSLYSLLVDKCNDGHSSCTDEQAILSRVAIRNFEVLSDFITQIEFGKLYRSIPDSNISEFFKRVEKYHISTYDIEPSKEGGEKSKYKSIEFSYASVLSDLKDEKLFSNLESSIDTSIIINQLSERNFSPKTLKRIVNEEWNKENGVFNKEPKLRDKWNSLPDLVPKRRNARIHRKEAEIILKQFIKDNNLE